MFIWSFVTVTNGLQAHQPEMFAACQRWFEAAKSPGKLAKVLAKEYPDLVARMSELARTMPGYVSHKTFVAEDGERTWRTPYDDCVLVMPSMSHVKPGNTMVRLGRFETAGSE